MKRSITKYAGACIAAAGLLAAGPALAQDNAATTSPGNGQTMNQNEDGRSWGWIGLLGLLGLMGMRRKHDDHTDYRGTTRRDNIGPA